MYFAVHSTNPKSSVLEGALACDSSGPSSPTRSSSGSSSRTRWATGWEIGACGRRDYWAVTDALVNECRNGPLTLNMLVMQMAVTGYRAHLEAALTRSVRITQRPHTKIPFLLCAYPGIRSCSGFSYESLLAQRLPRIPGSALSVVFPRCGGIGTQESLLLIQPWGPQWNQEFVIFWTFLKSKEQFFCSHRVRSNIAILSWAGQDPRKYRMPNEGSRVEQDILRERMCSANVRESETEL
ncbi:hypothetical protein B0H13DRAFT_1887631 [Mycena leptocephala]|nr:hypothetical protein B0H13DRAFT_1887631 [Mycena leptocephala]